MTGSAYRDTSVSVERSQGQIRALLVKHGASAFSVVEDWGAAPRVGFSFSYMKRWTTVEGGKREQHVLPFSVRMVVPVWTERTGPASRYTRQAQAQRERQVWRGLYWFLKARLEAAEFQLAAFEDIFLADLVMRDDRTVSEAFRESLSTGRMALALPAPEVAPRG